MVRRQEAGGTSHTLRLCTSYIPDFPVKQFFHQKLRHVVSLWSVPPWSHFLGSSQRVAATFAALRPGRARNVSHPIAWDRPPIIYYVGNVVTCVLLQKKTVLTVSEFCQSSILESQRCYDHLFSTSFEEQDDADQVKFLTERQYSQKQKA